MRWKYSTANCLVVKMEPHGGHVRRGFGKRNKELNSRALAHRGRKRDFPTAESRWTTKPLSGPRKRPPKPHLCVGILEEAAGRFNPLFVGIGRGLPAILVQICRDTEAASGVIVRGPVYVCCT